MCVCVCVYISGLFRAQHSRNTAPFQMPIQRILPNYICSALDIAPENNIFMIR